MTANDIITALVKDHFDFTFDYENEVYGADNRRIIFIKGAFKSTPIFMKELNPSHIDSVKADYTKSI